MTYLGCGYDDVYKSKDGRWKCAGCRQPRPEGYEAQCKRAGIPLPSKEQSHRAKEAEARGL